MKLSRNRHQGRSYAYEFLTATSVTEFNKKINDFGKNGFKLYRLFVSKEQDFFWAIMEQEFF